MAFADLMLGAISAPFHVYSNEVDYGLWKPPMPTTLLIFSLLAQNVFLYASVISATFISGKRLYATYWPLKHRTLTARAYRVLIFSVSLLALLASAIFALGIQLHSSKLASYALLVFFCILVTIFCGCNIAIGKKLQHRNIGDSQCNNKTEVSKSSA